MRVRTTAAALLLAAVMTPPASATIVSGTLTGGSAQASGGTFQIIAPPATVAANAIEGFDYLGWNEKQNVVLTANVAVDFLWATGSPGVVAAGTRVSSHGLLFDPPNKGEKTAIGWVKFNQPIVGVIFRDKPLVDSDFLGSTPPTVYTSYANRGLEVHPFHPGGRDKIFKIDAFTLGFDQVALSPGDNMRVLTVVPEPTTWAMMIAGFGLVGLAARARRRSLIA
ncbi:MAG: PEPxxWA-CTERM sorting domain-containing protein [Sphingomonadaceae bacterium]|uniref:PEPxxWA-CTERM sorting domain-containing protein n=1 Tax=Thermaurantiacus sp. TaxID=2820283 RepID=UPI00298EF8AC|nr:PEPxxWA-CTERM sorting domain-containing protein [Thermaurantiacus sp.]MCS6986151.1 PEPxxWA-CTERM sorting domain-containing protein [Sphingomonadaceae bacterium]MDW8414623.1 PEPxxWA-CTERM sorting domain-containing protein [Thermaurantiacus sp.]